MSTAHLRPLARAVRPSRPQCRSASFFGFGKKDGEQSVETPATSKHRSLADLLKHSPKAAAPVAPARGSLDDSSIFSEEPEAKETSFRSGEMNNELLTALRDPQRQSQWGWPRRAEAREFRHRGRLTKAERIAQTEKEHTVASHFFKTSVKKLAPLARQIHGKRIEHAIVQMRFSPKKAARDVLAHLYHARNEAVVRREMKADEVYIAEAWVGRGPFQKGYNHRARGRIDVLRLPYTMITVRLKEKATLERIAKEKEAKRLRRSVRQHLPSRPVYGQRQYYLW